MYNYQGGPPFGHPPSFGGFPGQNAPGMGAPPGMGPPPGMAAPGTGPPPGMQSNEQQPQRPGGFPPNFQPPANMSNINFNAPVIRLGTTGPSKPAPLGSEGVRRETDQRSGRAGLGMDMNAQRQALRENMMQLIPPTKEEIVRTIYIGGITEGIGGDDNIERILRSAGNLRRWIRAIDSDNKACRFGFAEYEDPESLATAVEVLKNVEVPIKIKDQATNGVKMEEGEEDEEKPKVSKSKLNVVVDESTYTYIEQWEDSRADRDPIQAQLRLDAGKSALASVLAELENPKAFKANEQLSKIDQDGDVSMQNGDDKPEGEVVTIPLSADDELSDIPAEMRETVAKEIQAFRDRSTRRDMERLKREEEMEAMERRRNLGQRANRLASPPAGPAGGANGIPLGPRGNREVPNAPAGPKGYSDSQQPKDYQKGVAFVNGTGIHGASTDIHIDHEDSDTDVSDTELERRRQAKKEAEQEKQYQDQKRRWLNRERSRTAALERETNRDKDESGRKESEKDIVARRLREWNDDVEASRKSDAYYVDRSIWLRNRIAFRTQEANVDAIDRDGEKREQDREKAAQEAARGAADDFLNRQAVELAPAQPQRIKLSLGAATQRHAKEPVKRTVAEVEGLLEDEDADEKDAKRTLIPIEYDDAKGLTEEERAQAVRQLAADIPSDKGGLWEWKVKWEFLDDAVIAGQIRPFVEKKIVEYLGVQEQMLVEVVEDHIRKRGGPQDLVGELEGALDDEAEALVKKLWRMIIFFSESEKKGLQA